jgi:hypothetical protein
MGQGYGAVQKILVSGVNGTLSITDITLKEMYGRVSADGEILRNNGWSFTEENTYFEKDQTGVEPGDSKDTTEDVEPELPGGVDQNATTESKFYHNSDFTFIISRDCVEFTKLPETPRFVIRVLCEKDEQGEPIISSTTIFRGVLRYQHNNKDNNRHQRGGYVEDVFKHHMDAYRAFIKVIESGRLYRIIK